ncbi:MAG: glycerol-3-phosphate dehydrogenase [Bacteroidetes bacterium]|nr:MAG: glycerol-3-phosphate dehydrogenase [Bacteroidota bacterium]
MRFGVIGSGSWATALAKILTDNQASIIWWVRDESAIEHIRQRHHNPHYLSSVLFDISKVNVTNNLEAAIKESECILIAVPSAYIHSTLHELPREIFQGKIIISAVKGILPEHNVLLNEYLKNEFSFELADYFTVMGPCHAEEVAAEKLSYLTFSGLNETLTTELASYFMTDYLNTVTNNDVYGVQYAAVLKNIYAMGAGMAHGLEYGDNFLSVLIANCADEMAGFLRRVGIGHIEVGVHEESDPSSRKSTNYAASAYLGDLLVTCYSLYSRNRTFGNMIGKGYSVKVAQLELSMVAEGYNASRCIYLINQKLKAPMPIASIIYQILWENVKVEKGFKQIETFLV